MNKLKLAFKLWFYIACMMSLVIFCDYLLFIDLIQSYFWYIKEIFVGLFLITIIISFFVINAYFEAFNIQIDSKTKLGKYFKIYFGILWRALIILIPIIGFIAYKYQDSIESRIITIILEILAGFPAIWWFLNSKKVKFN